MGGVDETRGRVDSAKHDLERRTHVLALVHAARRSGVLGSAEAFWKGSRRSYG